MTSYIITAGPGFQDNARSPGQAEPHITWGALLGLGNIAWRWRKLKVLLRLRNELYLLTIYQGCLTYLMTI